MPEANYNAALASKVGWQEEEVPLLSVSVQRNRASSTPLTCFSARVAELDLMAEITKKVSHVLPRISFHASYID
jgi:hypothetical protein